MLPIHAIVFDPNDIVGVIWIIFFQMQQYFQLDPCLMLELFLISNNFDCNNFSRFMIDTF
jgi:hypothetical protein